MRIAIAGVSMEALTRSPLLTEHSAVQIYRGPELLERGLWLVRGMVSRLREENDVEIVPLMWATALPGGPMALDVYRAIREETIALLTKNGPLDGVLLANHGALEVEGLGAHGDSDFIAAVRETIGSVPLAIAFDLHGNLSPEIARAGTVFSALRTAPHRDDTETGYRAADQLLTVLRRRLRPKTAFVPIPILVVGEAAVTSYEPARSLYASLREIEALSGVMQAILMVGFAWNDAPHSGMTAMVTTESDGRLAADLASDLARRVWSLRRDFRIEIESAEIDEGIARAANSRLRPVFLSDAGDNTTAGAPGDSTLVLQRMLALGVTDAVIVGITAPSTVRRCHEAGVGAEVGIELGADHISLATDSLPVTAVVEAVDNGLELKGFQPYRTREGAWARVRIGGIVATFHAQPIGITTPHHFEAMDISPAAHQLYVVKLGYLHPQLEDVAGRHIILQSPGVADLDLTRLTWSHVRRPIYPLDADMAWRPNGSTTLAR